MKYTVAVDGRYFDIEVEHDRLVRVNGCPLYVDLEQVGGLPVYSLVFEDAAYVLFVDKGQGVYHVEVQGRTYPVDVKSQRPRLRPRQIECPGEEGECLAILAPLAGRLISLRVTAGDRVEAGQVVAVVESMKMQMELKAPEAAVVEAVYGLPDQDTAQGEVLVTLRTG